MKLWTNLISVLLSVVMFTTATGSALAVKPQDSIQWDISLSSENIDQLEQEGKLRIVNLTPQQFAKRYKEITGEEAVIPYANYQTQEITYVDEDLLDMGYGIEIGCLLRLACGQSCSWKEVIAGTAYSEAVGSGNYEWNPSYAYAEIREPVTNKSLQMRARGTIEIKVLRSNSQGGSMGVGLEFVDAGYTYSNSVGQTDYFRKSGSIEHIIYEND